MTRGRVGGYAFGSPPSSFNYFRRKKDNLVLDGKSLFEKFLKKNFRDSDFLPDLPF